MGDRNHDKFEILNAARRYARHGNIVFCKPSCTRKYLHILSRKHKYSPVLLLMTDILFSHRVAEGAVNAG